MRTAGWALIGALWMTAAFGLTAAEVPEAEISNGLITAKLYLPDPERGYYRGTRFDWSGVMPSLKYAGHEYFGQWFPSYDPKLHDAIMGPVEEFRTGDSSLGYEQAKPGETFIRIGVGVVRKPEERRYQTFRTYDIVDPGKWTVRKGSDRVEFIHELKDETGYAYVYSKIVRLVKGKPELVLEHALKNTGRRPIETSQYNHNFFVIDGRPTGPDFVVKFPFELQSVRELQDAAQVRGGELNYLRELQKGQSVFTELKGFGPSAKDYDIRIENRAAGAGVRIVGDKPLSKIVFWSIQTTVCPEPYIDLQVKPGGQAKWRIRYEFYTLPAAAER
jgi:hypothetical protein